MPDLVGNPDSWFSHAKAQILPRCVHNNNYVCLITVISLKGVPYRSGPIRIRAKNGSWVTTKTEWSSFVNPWTKRLEFIIGKHTVVK